MQLAEPVTQTVKLATNRLPKRMQRLSRFAETTPTTGRLGGQQPRRLITTGCDGLVFEEGGVGESYVGLGLGVAAHVPTQEAAFGEGMGGF